MYSIIWLTRSLIRPHTVCGGSLGQPATALNLFLIFGSLMELFVLGRASGVRRNALSRTSANTRMHTHRCWHRNTGSGVRGQAMILLIFFIFYFFHGNWRGWWRFFHTTEACWVFKTFFFTRAVFIFRRKDIKSTNWRVGWKEMVILHLCWRISACESRILGKLFVWGVFWFLFVVSL